MNAFILTKKDQQDLLFFLSKNDFKVTSLHLCLTGSVSNTDHFLFQLLLC